MAQLGTGAPSWAELNGIVAPLFMEDVALMLTSEVVSVTSRRELIPIMLTGELVDCRAKERRHNVLSNMVRLKVERIAMLYVFFEQLKRDVEYHESTFK